MKQLNGHKPRFLNLSVEGYEDQLSPQLRGLVRDFARQMVSVYDERVSGCLELVKAYPNDEWIQKHWTPENIEKFGSGKDQLRALETIRSKPFEQITWGDVHNARAQDEEGAVTAIAALHEGAADHISAGIFATDVVGFRTPFERAQFSVIRNSFIEEWQPRGGIEAGLVDMLAQAYVGWQFWLSRSFAMAHNENSVREQKAKTKNRYDEGQWQPPRVSYVEALEQATQMADRFQRMFLRALRQMRDLRRYASPVTIHNPQQVNIAAEGGQQINSQKGARGKKRKAKASARPPLKMAAKS